MRLNVDIDAVVQHTNRLEKMHRSAFPNAVRTTLNKAAMDVKQVTMPRFTQALFVNRQKNFFKANSRVEFASGYNVKDMQSAVGFVSRTRTADQAVDELEHQEYGGDIKGRSYMPKKAARVSKSNKKNIRAQLRLKKITNIVDANQVNAKTAKQKFVRAALMAKKLYGNDAYVLGNIRYKGVATLSRIDRISSDIATRKLNIERTPVYSYKKGRTAQIKGKKFMQRASRETGLKINQFYIAAAEVQFLKFAK